MIPTNGHKYTKIGSCAQRSATCFGHLHGYKIEKLDNLKLSNIFTKLSETIYRCNYKNQRFKNT